MPVHDRKPVFTKAQSERLEALSHAIQSGVAAEHELLGSNDGSPKHLRTGVNLRAVEHGALSGLLMDKGIITAEEYASSMIAALEMEVTSYEDRLTKALGKRVTLA